jgi:hypothetical protein
MRAYATGRAAVIPILRPCVLAASLLLCSCASRQPYPRHWPTLAESVEICSGLSGEYRNQGEMGDGHLTWLSTLLFDGPIATDSMTLVVQDGDRPVVRAALGDLEPVVLPREILSCEDGVLVVRPRGQWVGAASEFGLFSVGRRSTTLELHAAENALVIRVKTRTNVVVTAIPWTSSGQTWHRFERLPHESQNENTSLRRDVHPATRRGTRSTRAG